MNNLFVEADKSFFRGFVLTETELRRIVQIMIEQLKKEGISEVFNRFYIKFENGTIAETENIDTIFALENTGSGKIIHLGILYQNLPITDKEENEETRRNTLSFWMAFNDINSENNNSLKPVRYLLRGKSRDWVMVSSSLIEERIAKIKRKRYTIKHITNFKTGILMIVAFSFIVILAMMPGLDQDEVLRVTLNEVDSLYRSNPNLSTNELILKIEKSKLPQIEKTNRRLIVALLAAPFVIIFLMSDRSLLNIIGKIYPAYNFYWGDYIEEFNRTEKLRKSIITFIIITILIGIFVNIASTFIWDNFITK